MDTTKEEKERIKEKIDKLKASKFKQQTLPAWRPQPTTASTMVTFAIFSLIFFAIGILLKTKSDEIYENVLKYSSTCDKVTASTCSITISVDQDVPGPVFVYYEIDNFFQNHRRYVKSRSDKQLAGKYLGIPALTNCDPVKKMGDLQPHQRFNINKQPLDVALPAIPCGLVAKSVFNDTYALSQGKTQVAINQTGIAWDSDMENKFKNMNQDLPSGKSWQDVQWLDMTDEHFIVWMRTSGLPNFRKLWGKIENGLTKGNYQVQIANNYKVDKLQGTKKFVLSTTNNFGGKNYFLAYCFIAVGAINVLFVLIFLCLHFKQ